MGYLLRFMEYLYTFSWNVFHGIRMEYAIQKIKEKCKAGINIQDEAINMLKFADDKKELEGVLDDIIIT